MFPPSPYTTCLDEHGSETFEGILTQIQVLVRHRGSVSRTNPSATVTPCCRNTKRPRGRQSPYFSTQIARLLVIRICAVDPDGMHLGLSLSTYRRQ